MDTLEDELEMDGRDGHLVGTSELAFRLDGPGLTDPLDAPQVVPVPVEHYPAVGKVLAMVGYHLYHEPAPSS